MVEIIIDQCDFTGKMQILEDVEAVQPTLTKIQQCVQNKKDLNIRNGMIFVEFAYIKRVLMTST